MDRIDSAKCQGHPTPYIVDGHPTFNDGNPFNGYINPYYWVDDHPLYYGNNGSLHPSIISQEFSRCLEPPQTHPPFWDHSFPIHSNWRTPKDQYTLPVAAGYKPDGRDVRSEVPYPVGAIGA